MAEKADKFVARLQVRLKNPAVSLQELRDYINAAIAAVDPQFYTPAEYEQQVLDQACQLLYGDGKFPDIQSQSTNGISTSFSGDGPDKFRERLEARRVTAWMDNDC
jgi:hypothetical protein